MKTKMAMCCGIVFLLFLLLFCCVVAFCNLLAAQADFVFVLVRACA